MSFFPPVQAFFSFLGARFSPTPSRFNCRGEVLLCIHTMGPFLASSLLCKGGVSGHHETLLLSFLGPWVIPNLSTARMGPFFSSGSKFSSSFSQIVFPLPCCSNVRKIVWSVWGGSLNLPPFLWPFSPPLEAKRQRTTPLTLKQFFPFSSVEFTFAL